jgi:hypothetical protein
MENRATINSMKKCLATRLAPATWVPLAIVAAVLYGIINDQITVSLSPEYFSVFKRQQFWDLLVAARFENAPTRVQAIVIGAAATWWVGMLLGLMVGVAGAIGRAPRLTTRQFLKAVGLVMLVAAGTSLAFGCVGCAQGPVRHGSEPGKIDEIWPFLQGIRDTRRAFAVGCWHDGAYLGGLIGTILACWRVRKWRRHG